MLIVLIEDVRRATLPLHSGNEGWIGVSPDGQEYHVVVPVDAQIARGVMACNRPTDGTPFGGYVGWLYFRCQPYPDEGPDEHRGLDEQVRLNCRDLLQWLALYEIQAGIVSVETATIIGPGSLGEQCDNNSSAPAVRSSLSSVRREVAFEAGDHEEARDGSHAGKPQNTDAGRPRETACPSCGRLWKTGGEFRNDLDLRLMRYRACPENFRKGTFVFRHSCGNMIEVPVDRFVRPRAGERSLIGSHACPGLCYYESSFRSCSARCEGSRYRRIAERIKVRELDRGNENQRKKSLPSS